VLAKHSKSFSPIDCISVGVDRMQRNFEPMRKQVEACQKSELTDMTAKSAEGSTFFKSTKSNPFETSSGRSRCVVVVLSSPFSVVRTVIVPFRTSIQLALACLNEGPFCSTYLLPHRLWSAHRGDDSR
jgi:hypothetical protein